MTTARIACARCATANHPSNRFCERCDLPLGAAQADAGAALDVLGPYEAPEPCDASCAEVLADLAACAGFEATPFGPGWRLVVPLHLDRAQAVYVGPAGTDPAGRPLLSLVSVCGPANERDARTLLKLNARAVDGHFAIQVLRGEEYFVVVQTLAVEAASRVDAAALVRQIARAADGLEDRLLRGRDLY